MMLGGSRPGTFQNLVRPYIPRYPKRVGAQMTFRVEVEHETDGRWIAEVIELSGAMAYGATRDEAVSKVQALALRVVADRLDHGEAGSSLLSIAFRAV
jgi:predicted RNase H-like HicB family nuclease